MRSLPNNVPPIGQCRLLFARSFPYKMKTTSLYCGLLTRERERERPRRSEASVACDERHAPIMSLTYCTTEENEQQIVGLFELLCSVGLLFACVQSEEQRSATALAMATAT